MRGRTGQGTSREGDQAEGQMGARMWSSGSLTGSARRGRGQTMSR
jgi:hypothetical protein